MVQECNREISPYYNAATVKMIFRMYCQNKMSRPNIILRLNEHLETVPPQVHYHHK